MVTDIDPFASSRNMFKVSSGRLNSGVDVVQLNIIDTLSPVTDALWILESIGDCARPLLGNNVVDKSEIHMHERIILCSKARIENCFIRHERSKYAFI